MKKVLIVNASKRRKGNSYALEKRVMEQLKGVAEATVLHIGEDAVNLPVTHVRGSTRLTVSRRIFLPRLYLRSTPVTRC